METAWTTIRYTACIALSVIVAAFMVGIAQDMVAFFPDHEWWQCIGMPLIMSGLCWLGLVLAISKLGAIISSSENNTHISCATIVTYCVGWLIVSRDATPYWGHVLAIGVVIALTMSVPFYFNYVRREEQRT